MSESVVDGNNADGMPTQIDEECDAQNMDAVESTTVPQEENVTELPSAELQDNSESTASVVAEEAEATSTHVVASENQEVVSEEIQQREDTTESTAPVEGEKSEDNIQATDDQVCAPSSVVNASEADSLDECAKSGFVPEAKSSNINGGVSENSTDAETSNTSDNCYCGRKRNLNFVEFQCAGCSKWFHEACISISVGKCLPFMTNYVFFCKMCTPSGSESFSKKQPNFSQMCATALANLTQQSIKEEQPRTMFSKDKEIIPYIVNHWEYLTSMQRRVKQTWHSTVYKVMMKDSDLFVCDSRGQGEMPAGDRMFGLANQDLLKICPCYDSGPRTTIHRQSQDTVQTATGFTGKGRSAKRRFFDGQIASGGKKNKSDLVMPKLPPNGYPAEHPFNKDGYRYILAEPDEHAPFRKEFDESEDWAGKRIPGWLYRKLVPNIVVLALNDRAPQLKISEDRLSVTGEKGYCMVRGTHGISKGTWYFEITVKDMPDGAAVRLGWSQALANLQAPLGYDKFSYSWRSRKGTKFHESKGYHYADEGYGKGDTLGFLIHLPLMTESVVLPPVFKDKTLVKFKSYLYYEEKDELQLELKRMKPLPCSKIECFKNGQSTGVAFENINAGTYYPAASLYKSCYISFNFGPDFKFPPGTTMHFKPMFEAAHDELIEQTMADLLFFTENKGKLRLDNI